MEPNNLVVTVLCARGLMLKGHTDLNVSTTICLQGKGSLRSKCLTEKVEGTTDIQWNESCEFKIMEGANKLTASVIHHPRIGGNDLIGKAEISLSDIIDVSSATWFPLLKRPKDEKYRGEVLLQFKFSYVKPQLSISNLSLNTIPKDTVLAKMKRKMKLGKKDKDSVSVFSSFAPSMRRLDKPEPSDSIVNKSFHEAAGRSMGNVSSSSRMNNSLDVFIPPPIATSSPFQSPNPNHQSQYMSGSNLNISNISTAESFGNISTLQRQNSRRSFASSGFGSSKSKGGKKGEEERVSGQSEWDLAAEVDRLRAELAVKDSRLKDMEEYIDTLVKKVMEHHPELLAKPSTRGYVPSMAFNFR